MPKDLMQMSRDLRRGSVRLLQRGREQEDKILHVEDAKA